MKTNTNCQWIAKVCLLVAIIFSIGAQQYAHAAMPDHGVLIGGAPAIGPATKNAAQTPPTMTITGYSCSGGRSWTGSSCVCPPNYSWDGMSCIVIPPPAPGITATLSGYRKYEPGVIFDSLTTYGGHFEVPSADIRYINTYATNMIADGAIIRAGKVSESNISLHGGTVLSGVLIDPSVTFYGKNMTINGVSYGSCMVYYRKGGTAISTVC